MEELGYFLKQRREEKGVSLEEIQEKTKVGTRYLYAIEKGDFDVIPGRVYVVGFLKKYAECVGLDPKEIIDRYEELEEIKEREKNRSAVRKEKREQEKKKTRLIIGGILGAILVIGGIVGLIYYFFFLE